MAKAVFQRVEKKYILTQTQYEMLMHRISRNLRPDEYSDYTISNIYFDNINYDLIRASIEKPVYKEKLRLRSYGRADAGSSVFIELKKKYKGVVYKRRATMPYLDAVRFLNSPGTDGDSEQIMREIEYFMKLYNVFPRVFISYDRLAYSGIEDSELRVTFDRNIRFRENELRLDTGPWGTELAEPGTLLMEIKVPGAFPLWLSHTLNELEIFPSPFSKYGTCYKNHIAPKKPGRGEVAASA